ncbi:MAG: M56 family metallopeptidase [Clostridia bacterium]|nr:M56 family metallopeptidase [Clostridia bacterium]
MTAVFHYILNISIPVLLLVAAVMAYRFIFRKAPKWINCVLWAVVGLRLIFPIPLESFAGLLPRMNIIDSGNVVNIFDPAPVGTADSFTQGSAAVSQMAGLPRDFDLADALNTVYFIIWVAGIIVMLAAAAASYIKMRRKLKASIKINDGVYFCDYVDSAFIFGVFKPKIYVPSYVDKAKLDCILAHENAHLKRHDHWWKPLGYLILAVYWFNPAVWVAYIFLCRDIELACDEKVIRDMSAEEIADYSQTLLEFSKRQKSVLACPLAFGEVGVKQRIKSALNYKKPALWIIIAAIIASIVVAVCFTTSRKENKIFQAGIVDYNPEEEEKQSVYNAIVDTYIKDKDMLGECSTAGYVIYGAEEKENEKKIYAYVSYEGFGFQNGYFAGISGGSNPAVITVDKKTGERRLFAPGDGSDYVKDIKKLFPVKYQYRALNPTEKDYQSMWEQETEQAQKYLDSIGRKAEICSYSQVEHKLLSDYGIDESKTAVITKRYNFNDPIGSYEAIENGIRYVYQTDFDEKTGMITYTKYEYETKKIALYIRVNSATGEIISSNPSADYKPEYYIGQKADDEYTTVAVESESTTASEVIIDDGYTKASKENKSTTKVQTTNIMRMESQDIIDSITTDYDNDGVKETIQVLSGPTSGLYTLTVKVIDGKNEYSEVFMPENQQGFDNIRLTEKGGKVYFNADDGGKTKTYQVTVNHNVVSLKNGSEEMPYWGGKIKYYVTDNSGREVEISNDDSLEIYSLMKSSKMQESTGGFKGNIKIRFGNQGMVYDSDSGKILGSYGRFEYTFPEQNRQEINKILAKYISL